MLDSSWTWSSSRIRHRQSVLDNGKGCGCDAPKKMRSSNVSLSSLHFFFCLRVTPSVELSLSLSLSLSTSQDLFSPFSFPDTNSRLYHCACAAVGGVKQKPKKRKREKCRRESGETSKVKGESKSGTVRHCAREKRPRKWLSGNKGGGSKKRKKIWETLIQNKSWEKKKKGKISLLLPFSLQHFLSR